MPSLPGFGFSGKPAGTGWSSQRMAEAFAKLMARLGYTRYGAQGGDWGGGITGWLAGSDGAHCLGGHSNFPGANRPADDPMRGVSEAEMQRFQKRVQELSDQKAYGAKAIWYRPQFASGPLGPTHGPTPRRAIPDFQFSIMPSPKLRFFGVAAMKPSTPKTEPPPSTQLRKAVSGGSIGLELAPI